MEPTALLAQPGAALRAPHGIWVGGAINLAVNVWAAGNTIAVTIAGRLRLPDGRLEPFESTVPATNVRSVTTTLVVLGEGWLEELVIYAPTGSPSAGQCYVTVDLVQGLTGATKVLDTLLGGYVTVRQRRRWPNSPILDSLTGPGSIRSITGTDPAAGVEISETVPAGARWRLLSLSATLVTGAAVANRRPRLLIDDGTAQLAVTGTPEAITASQTKLVSWMRNGAGSTDPESGVLEGLVPDVLLLAGYRLRTQTANLDAGDNWSAPQYLVEEWLEGA